MHMETNDQSGIPPVTLQRIGCRPLHLYLIFLLVCVHDHSPYQQPDVTILNESHLFVIYWLRSSVSIEVRTIIRQKHMSLSFSQDYWLYYAADVALYEKICTSLLRVPRFLDQQEIVPSMTFNKDLFWFLESLLFNPEPSKCLQTPIVP